MSWRLPSGKGLAEFALQSGFLAPLLLGGSGFKGKWSAAPGETLPVAGKVEEVPDSAGTFQGTR